MPADGHERENSGSADFIGKTPLMRKWRSSVGAAARPMADTKLNSELNSAEQELQRLVAAAPSKNREFHASDLRRQIGQKSYDARAFDAPDR